MTDELQELLREAAEETRRGGLIWKAFNDENFRTPIATGMLVVCREHVPFEDAEGNSTVEPVYRTEVSDDLGRVVAEADSTDATAGLFENLFEAARKSALRPDRVIGEMLQALRKRESASAAVAPAVTSR